MVAGQTISYLTPLSPLQRQILSLLELSEAIYERFHPKTSFLEKGLGAANDVG